MHQDKRLFSDLIRSSTVLIALGGVATPLTAPAPAHAQSAESAVSTPTKSRDQEQIYRHAVPQGFETEIFVADAQGQARAERIIELYKILSTNPTIEAVSAYISPAYIQHNPMLPNGAPPVAMLFGASVAQYPTEIDVHKVAVVGDFAVAHVNFRNLSTEDPEDLGTAAVDMYLFSQDGMIVEHWDVLQTVPSHSANQNGMFLTLFKGGE